MILGHVADVGSFRTRIGQDYTSLFYTHGLYPRDAARAMFVHLAGGMGKPVFLLDRYDHCWRWLSGRGDSPWYPAMRIFRQNRIGDWTAVLQQATAALVEFSERLVPNITVL